MFNTCAFPQQPVLCSLVGVQEEEEKERKSMRVHVSVCVGWLGLVVKDPFVKISSSLCFYPRQRLHLTPRGLCFLRSFSD